MAGLKKREFSFDKNSDRLFEAIMALNNTSECESFFRAVMTLSELQAVTERFQVARALAKGDQTYREINKETGVSTATITRVADWMRNEDGGYKLAIERLDALEKSGQIT